MNLATTEREPLWLGEHCSLTGRAPRREYYHYGHASVVSSHQAVMLVTFSVAFGAARPIVGCLRHAALPNWAKIEGAATRAIPACGVLTPLDHA